MIQKSMFGFVAGGVIVMAMFSIGNPAFAQMTRMNTHPSMDQTAPHMMQHPMMGQTVPRIARPVFHRTMLSAADRQFVMKAAQGGMAEVALGRLAQQRGISPAVKRFGARMVTDHSQANAQLKQIALREGIRTPTSLSRQNQANLRRLSRLSGTAFDRAYRSMMVRDHVGDIAEFQREASGGRDPGIKRFASSTLPTLREHLQMARSMGTMGRSHMVGSAR